MSGTVADLAVIGAGPCGLSAGIAARQAGLDLVLFDAACLVHAISLYPTFATFFSSADRLELGGIPFIPAGDKPTRTEALKYYRRLARDFRLGVRQYERVVAVEGLHEAFTLTTRARGGSVRRCRARNVVVATGYAGNPNLLGVPGEDLAKVTHYFTEGHRYYDQDCLVVGAGNSAVEVALDVYRSGGRVTLVHFLDRLDRGVKPWILPDIENRLRNKEIQVLWNTRVVRIEPDRVRLRHEGTGVETEIPNDFVLAMTGYHPDFGLLTGLSATVDPETGVPHHDPATMETDVPGVFIAGVIAGGNRPDQVFIEDGRHHGPLAVRSILKRLGRAPAGPISLGIAPDRRPVDREADGSSSQEELDRTGGPSIR
jgi:thioredoxin reductase (NADPH)